MQTTVTIIDTLLRFIVCHLFKIVDLLFSLREMLIVYGLTVGSNNQNICNTKIKPKRLLAKHCLCHQHTVYYCTFYSLICIYAENPSVRL